MSDLEPDHGNNVLAMYFFVLVFVFVLGFVLFLFFVFGPSP